MYIRIHEKNETKLEVRSEREREEKKMKGLQIAVCYAKYTTTIAA